MNDHPSLRPLGWEGTLPDEGISGPDVLLRYLSTRLDKVRLFGNRPSGLYTESVHPDFTQKYYQQAREALRNALRGFDYLAIDNRVTPWPRDEENLSHHELEYRLSEVVRCLSKQVAQDDNQAADIDPTPSLPKLALPQGSSKQDRLEDPDPEPMKPVRSRQFLGGEDLADYFGIPHAKRDSFFKQLSRYRIQLGDEFWSERVNRPAKSAKYLYRVDCVQLAEIAKAYRHGK